MNKDIPFKKVEEVAIAILPELTDLGQEEWSVYLLNLKDEPIQTVLVSSTGYGEIDDRKVKTSTLRQLLGDIPPKYFIKIELIDQQLFSISNEFWISFWYHGNLYDKKYVFVSESIIESNFTEIPLINKRGVMIK